MKNNILKYFIIFLSLLIILIVYLSTFGIETDKFNDQIKSKISQINKNINVDLKKPIVTFFREFSAPVNWTTDNSYEEDIFIV